MLLHSKQYIIRLVSDFVCLVVFGVLSRPRQYIIWLFSGLCVWWCLACCRIQSNT